MKGLVIQKEHLNNILNGHKTVEIRKQNTKKREKIALCNKGKIYGFAKIVDSYLVPITELLTPQWKRSIEPQSFYKMDFIQKKKICGYGSYPRFRNLILLFPMFMLKEQ